MRRIGRVYFVGAGSGNPEYLTVKAHKLLKNAEVIAYDDLIHPSLLELAPADAELIPIGYRAFERRPEQHPLARDVVERALSGKDVIRLKSGDPFVFGRTQEEIEGLEAHDIPYEIVPGVSAIFGAAASFSIPLTHRKMASRVQISAGNHSTLEGPEQETLVVYMPRKKLRVLCQSLLDKGHDPQTPACFIQSASTPLETIAKATIEDLADQVERIPAERPGLVIIGDVVRFAKRMNTLPSNPCAGKRIVIARHTPGKTRIGNHLAREGADVINLPHLRYSEQLKNADGTPRVLTKAMKLTAPPPDAIVVPHSLAATELFKHDYGFDLCGIPFFVMGETSAAVLESHGVKEIVVSKTSDYLGLIDALENYFERGSMPYDFGYAANAVAKHLTSYDRSPFEEDRI